MCDREKHTAITSVDINKIKNMINLDMPVTSFMASKRTKDIKLKNKVVEPIRLRGARQILLTAIDD